MELILGWNETENHIQLAFNLINVVLSTRQVNLNWVRAGIIATFRRPKPGFEVASLIVNDRIKNRQVQNL